MKLDYCDESSGAFAAKYEGQSIRFDGVITDLASHEGAATRYDILISPGKKVETTVGPAFKYEDVNISSDLGWTGSNAPESVGTGSRLGFTAEVGEYDSDQCIFFLDPVATETRSPDPRRSEVRPLARSPCRLSGEHALVRSAGWRPTTPT
jgi:hypothetical protein